VLAGLHCVTLSLSLLRGGSDYIDLKSIKNVMQYLVTAQVYNLQCTNWVCKKEVYRKNLANLMQMLQENRGRIAPNIGNIPQTYEESHLHTLVLYELFILSASCLRDTSKLKQKVTSCARAFCIIMYSEIKC
jgi:hypothetical protein